jgi:hypothetical protein
VKQAFEKSFGKNKVPYESLRRYFFPWFVSGPTIGAAEFSPLLIDFDPNNAESKIPL